MVLSKNQAEILDKAIQGHSFAILGQSGTGKSFLVKQIAEKLREINKVVQVTATTGIASVNIAGKTVHSWCGIGDGRFSNDVLIDKLENNDIYSKYKENIINTQCLIIDEISMLSMKLFNEIEFICRKILKSSLIFGGLQVIVVGDFFQLPPVPDHLKMDGGEYCFISPVFVEFFKHKFVLTEAMRQHQVDFIKAINDISRGDLPDDTHNLLRRLSRKLPPGDEPIRLCARNFDCDLYNACKLMDMEDEEHVHVCNSFDEGDIRKLERLPVPKHLHLKLGCPVMLLKNLSESLVNGLRGTVIGFKADAIIVNFTNMSENIKTKQIEVKKGMFTVYSSIENKVIASRKQFPLCLSYCITIHKAQGLTLNRVVVDASFIFAPGQLGVAIGRAKEKKGLQIIGFQQNAVLKHDASLYKYYENNYLMEFCEDLSCCKKNFNIQNTCSTNTVVDLQEEELSDFSDGEIDEIDFLISNETLEESVESDVMLILILLCLKSS